MIVTCPGCASKYRVRNEAVPQEGARMRCPKCETLFLAKPPPPGSAGSATDNEPPQFDDLAGLGPAGLGPPGSQAVMPALTAPTGSFGPAKAAPPRTSPPSFLDHDPFATLDLQSDPTAEQKDDPLGLNVPTVERIITRPKTLEMQRPTLPPQSTSATPPPVPVPMSTSTSTRQPPAPPPPVYRPPSMAAQAMSWVVVVVGAVSAVAGAVFAGWTSESLDLDATLMATAEEKLDVRPPASFVGKDDVAIDELRREAKAKEDDGDLPAAAVLWQRVLDRDQTDAIAKAALPRVMTAMGERLR